MRDIGISADVRRRGHCQSLLFKILGCLCFLARSAAFLKCAPCHLILLENWRLRQTEKLTLPRLKLSSLGSPVCSYHVLTVPTKQYGPPRQSISVEDLTSPIKSILRESGMKNGAINVISRHTTTALTINERESRLAEDIADYLLKLAPPDERSDPAVAKHGVRYKHNDIDLRPDSAEETARCRENGWNIDDHKVLQAWREQEPINAHAHLLAILLGSSETIPVVDGVMVIGQWQSILLVDLDGPRERTVGVQLLGYT